MSKLKSIAWVGMQVNQMQLTKCLMLHMRVVLQCFEIRLSVNDIICLVQQKFKNQVKLKDMPQLNLSGIFASFLFFRFIHICTMKI